jgi:hypothetical protein
VTNNAKKSTKTGLFEYLNSINTGRSDIMVTDEDEKSYPGFMVNRGLSYYADTVLHANLMNVNHQLDPRLQYDFLRTSVTKKKRFSKWFKKDETKELEIISEWYKCSKQKAKEYRVLLNDEDINTLSELIDHGGFERKKKR